MQKRWNPEITTRKIIEIEDGVYRERLEELAELIYDAFCELHKIRSVEPKFKTSCAEQELEKVG